MNWLGISNSGSPQPLQALWLGKGREVDRIVLLDGAGEIGVALWTTGRSSPPSAMTRTLGHNLNSSILPAPIVSEFIIENPNSVREYAHL